MVKPVEIVESFLNTLPSMEMDKIMSFFDDRSSWQNVPHPQATGSEEIAEMFRPIITKSSSVRWDLINAVYESEKAWLERIDRFWIDDVEYSVQCNGVFELDTVNGIILNVRDYVDLGEWRDRLAQAELG